MSKKHMVKVFNLHSCVEEMFDPEVTPRDAVAHAYCEEQGLLSALYGARQDGPDALDAFYDRLPFSKGLMSLACGDWATVVRPGTTVAEIRQHHA